MKNNDEDGDVPSNMAIRALVTTKEAGIIIGKSGKNVNEIREHSGSRVNISEIVPGATERVLTITGRLDTIAKV
jgi:transcription antitermination factor NusA-like protein